MNKPNTPNPTHYYNSLINFTIKEEEDFSLIEDSPTFIKITIRGVINGISFQNQFIKDKKDIKLLNEHHYPWKKETVKTMFYSMIAEMVEKKIIKYGKEN